MFNRKKGGIIIFLTFAALLSAKAYYDTNTIEVKEYRIQHPALGSVLAGRKVAHISDLHITRMSGRENKVIEILTQEKPDLIFLTGDYIKNHGSYGPALSFIKQLKAPLGIYAVLGNSDYYNENGSCILCHKEGSRQLREKQNPVFLRNSHLVMKIDGKPLTVIGVDDPVNKKDDLKQSLTKAPPDAPTILLAHSPELFLDASNLGIDLVLSGHTHGGQLWITKYFHKIFPLEPALKFSEGFFQNGRTLLYVNRGIGTSALPFRFGVKPEITFFKFFNSSNQSNQVNPVQISNTPSKMVFGGIDPSAFLETFNFFHSIKNKSTHIKVPGKTNVLFDFESPADLQRLNWECHKWFELTELHKTSGQYCLRVSLPPGQYPGIDFEDIQPDWSRYAYLKMDIYNPSKEVVRFHIRIDDHKTNWKYDNRFDWDMELKPGLNVVSIPTASIQTNLHHRNLNLKKIERLMLFIPNNLKPRDLYIDNIRLN